MKTYFNWLCLTIALCVNSSFVLANFSVSVQPQEINGVCYGVIWVFASEDVGDFELSLFNDANSTTPIYEAVISANTNYHLLDGINGYGYQKLNGGANYNLRIITKYGCVFEEQVVFNCPCIESLQNDLSANISNPSSCSQPDGSIELIASQAALGGTAPYTFQWSDGSTQPVVTNLFNGQMSVTVSDANNCTTTGSFELITNDGPRVVYNYLEEASCTLVPDGSISILVEKQEQLNTIAFDWGFPSNDNTVFSSVNNLMPGTYCVTITEYYTNGGICVAEECYEVEQKIFDPIEIEANIIQECGLASQSSIELTKTIGGLGHGYSYSWSTGINTTQISNLSPGSYQLTVTDSCLNSMSFDFEIYPDIHIDIISDCYKEEYEIEDLLITGGDPPYKIYNYFLQASQTQILAVEDSKLCFTEIKIDESLFQTADPISMELLRGFGYNGNLSQSAIVKFYRSSYLGGEIQIIETGQNILANSVSIVHINPQFMNQDTFHFIYTDTNGCIEKGEFKIPVCSSNEGVSFSIEQLTEVAHCSVLAFHDYEINVNHIGDNNPYYIEFTMLDAFDTQNDQFQRIIELGNGPGIYLVENIPSGKLRVDAFQEGSCESGLSFTRTIQNCCSEFDCDVFIEEKESSLYDGSRIYRFKYFDLWLSEECFDGSCVPVIDEQCSKAWIEPIPNSGLDCWEGKIRITYPDESTEILEVKSSGEVEFYKKRLEKWKPDFPSSYKFKIEYLGTACAAYELDVDYFGEGNYSDAIILNSDWPWSSIDFNYTDKFYWSTQICEVCNNEEEFLFSDNNCDGHSNWQGRVYSFIPNDKSDPCNSGGQFAAFVFENGKAVLKEDITIPPGVALDQERILRAINTPAGEVCGEAYACFFNAFDIYGFDLDDPVLVTWADDLSCETYVPFGSGNGGGANPCNDITNPCPGLLICKEGNCYEPCNSNEDCISGNCLDGVCVPPDDCGMGCPSTYTCLEGECVEFICDIRMTRGKYHNGLTKILKHDLPAGSRIHIKIGPNGFGNDMWMKISGDIVDDYEYCRVPNEDLDLLRDHFIAGTNPKKEIIFEFPSPNECGESRNNHFDLIIECYGPAPVQKNVRSVRRRNSDSKSQIKIHPNPFSASLNVDLTKLKSFNKIYYVLYNLIGEKLLSNELILTKHKSIYQIEDIDHLNKGLYFIQFHTEDEILDVLRVLKQ